MMAYLGSWAGGPAAVEMVSLCARTAEVFLLCVSIESRLKGGCLPGLCLLLCWLGLFLPSLACFILPDTCFALFLLQCFVVDCWHGMFAMALCHGSHQSWGRSMLLLLAGGWGAGFWHLGCCWWLLITDCSGRRGCQRLGIVMVMVGKGLTEAAPSWEWWTWWYVSYIVDRSEMSLWCNGWALSMLFVSWGARVQIFLYGLIFIYIFN